MAIQYAIDCRAAMPPRYHPAAKAAQQSKPQRIGQESSRSNTQDAMDTDPQDPSEHDPTSQLHGGLDEHSQSQRTNDANAPSGPPIAAAQPSIAPSEPPNPTSNQSNALTEPPIASERENASSAPNHSNALPIAPSTEHPSRTRQRNEEQVDTFLSSLETHIETSNPALYSRLQSQYPRPSTSTSTTTEPDASEQRGTGLGRRRNETESRQRRHRIADEPAREFPRGPRTVGGGPQQTGANLVPVSGRRRRRGFGRDGGGEGGSEQTAAGDISRRREAVVGNGGGGEVGMDQQERVADTRGGGGADCVAGDGWGFAARGSETGQGGGGGGAEAEEGGRVGMAEIGRDAAGSGGSADGVPDDVDMEAEEGEERPKHDWSRTADW